MNKRLLNILIGVVSVLLLFFAFEILSMTYFHTDGSLFGILHLTKNPLNLMTALTGFFIVALIFLLVLKNKKGSVNTLPQ